MAERFKAPVLKTGEGLNLPWVRIPLSPPMLLQARIFLAVHVRYGLILAGRAAVRSSLWIFH